MDMDTGDLERARAASSLCTTTCTIVTQLFLSTPSITFRDYLIPSHHPIPPLQMHKYFVPVLFAAIPARTRLKSCVYYTAKEDQMMLSCQRWHLRSSSAPVRVHLCSLKVKEAALRFFLSSKCIPDAGKHCKTSTIRGNQLMIKRTRDAAGRIDTRHARRQLFDVCIRHRRPLLLQHNKQLVLGLWSRRARAQATLQLGSRLLDRVDVRILPHPRRYREHQSLLASLSHPSNVARCQALLEPGPFRRPIVGTKVLHGDRLEKNYVRRAVNNPFHAQQGVRTTAEKASHTGTLSRSLLKVGRRSCVPDRCPGRHHTRRDCGCPTRKELSSEESTESHSTLQKRRSFTHWRRFFSVTLATNGFLAEVHDRIPMPFTDLWTVIGDTEQLGVSRRRVCAPSVELSCNLPQAGKPVLLHEPPEPPKLTGAQKLTMTPAVLPLPAIGPSRIGGDVRDFDLT